jgi:hypothetical protein
MKIQDMTNEQILELANKHLVLTDVFDKDEISEVYARVGHLMNRDFDGGTIEICESTGEAKLV